MAASVLQAAVTELHGGPAAVHPDLLTELLDEPTEPAVPPDRLAEPELVLEGDQPLLHVRRLRRTVVKNGMPRSSSHRSTTEPAGTCLRTSSRRSNECSCPRSLSRSARRIHVVD